MNVPHNILYQNWTNGSAQEKEKLLEVKIETTLNDIISLATGPIQNNFAQMFPIMPSNKIAQKDCFHEIGLFLNNISS